MGRRATGFRHKSRSLLTRNPRERGKTTLAKILHGYEAGEKVVVNIDSSVQRGIPHRRYQGRVGVIVSKRGRSYVVHVPQGDATKKIIVRPEHLAPYSNRVGD
jgi:large subunit ribosomal protein L21e